jgi:hypothetical protein
MKKALVSFVVIVVFGIGAAAQSTRPAGGTAFQEKAKDALAAVDAVDESAPAVSFAMEYFEASKAVNRARMEARTAAERDALTPTMKLLFQVKTCRMAIEVSGDVAKCSETYLNQRKSALSSLGLEDWTAKETK